MFIILPGPASQKKLHKGTKGAVAWGRSWFEKMRRYLRKYLDNGDTMLRLHFGPRWTGTNLQRQPHQHRLVYVLSDFAASSWPINCARGHIIGRQTLKPWAWSAVGFSACRSAVCQLQCYYGHRLLITDTRRHAAILTFNIARGTTDPEIDSVTWQQHGTTRISCKFGHQMAPVA